MKTQVTQNNSYSANRTAEIAVWIIGILVFAFLLANKASANEIYFEDEAYINDIPFDTKMVVENLNNSVFQFEDEAYIDDIPFNTASINAQYLYEEAIAEDYNFEEESDIIDMPFETEVIAATYAYNLVLNENFEMSEENYVDDIPFNTCVIAANATSNTNNHVYACIK